MLKSASNNKTAKLWLQYWDMVELIRLYIRAERTGDWKLHLYCISEMLPFFHAAGHNNYARSAHLYLQDMLNLQNVLEPTEYKQFIANFAVRRTFKYWDGLWPDQVIEQVLMRSMKTRGGLTRGRGTSEATVAKWIASTAVCARVIDAVESFTNLKYKTNSEQHKDFRDSCKNRDAKDTNIMLTYMLPRSPFRKELENENVMSIASGVCGDESTNCFQAKNIGGKAIENIVGNNFCDVKITRQFKVKNIDCVTSSVTYKGEVVPIKPQQLLNRIGMAAVDESVRKQAFSYELTSQPPSLACKGFLRKNKKCSLVTYIAKNVANVAVPSHSQYVVDGGYVLHRCFWPQNISFINLYERHYNYIVNNYGTNCSIVFDAYTTMSTKDHERNRRKQTGKTRAAPNIIFDDHTLVTAAKKEFLFNDVNKQRFIIGLAKYLGERGVNVYHAEDDADYLIVMVALHQIRLQSAVTVVSQDTDVLVILCAHATRSQQLYLLQPGHDKASDRAYKISSVNKFFGKLKTSMLFCHAFCGCDTTSALYMKGKTKVITTLKKFKDIRKAISIFNNSNATKQELCDTCQMLLLKLYSPAGKEKDLGELRYNKYIDSLRDVNKTFEVESLPPSRPAADQHAYRVYHQVQAWLGVRLAPTDWGWVQRGNTLHPVLNIETLAPDWVLNVTSCNCKTGCNTGRCGCRRAGLYCSNLCTQCRDAECSNKEEICVETSDDDEL